MKNKYIVTIALLSLAVSCSDSTQVEEDKITRNKQEENMGNEELLEQATGFVDNVLGSKLNNPIVSTPEDYGLRYENVSFTTQDGVELSAWLLKGSTDRVIIQAHPVTTNLSGVELEGSYRTEQLKTANAFVNAGYSVLMFDARNHGKSKEGPVPYAVGSKDDAPDFIAAVDFILGRPEFENSNIGIHAQCFGVNAATHAFGLEDGLRSRENLKAISLTQPASWGMLMRTNAGDAFVDAVNEVLVERGATDLDATPLSDASKINVPTLVVQNQNDPSGTLEFVDSFYNAISTTKEKWMIEGDADRSYAYYHLTTNPERLVEWFDSQLK